MIPEEHLDRPARYSDLFAAPRPEHGSDCAYCPICSTIGVVRRTRPEVLDHLTAAAREILAVAGIVLEEAGEIISSVDDRTRDAREAHDGDKVRHLGPR